MSSSARAVLIGSVKRPELRVYFDPSEPHATATDKTLLEWVKWLPAAFWRQRGGYWLVTATGRAADHKFRQAGITVDLESETHGTDLEGVLCLDELVDPISRLAANGASALILPRLSGFDRTKELLGDGARWDRDYKRFVIPVADAMFRGAPRQGVIWDPPIIQAAIESLGRVTTRSDIAQIVADAGAAKSLAELDEDAVAKLKSVIGGVPDWFGLNLFEFQEAGAIAVAAGHNVLADEPGLGKTRQAIAAAAILGAERTVITCLPVGLTGWKNEVLESNLHTLGGKNPDGRTIVIRSGRKPEPFPEKGVIITSDSLLSARPELLKELIQWQPDVFAYDEAHRGKTYESARSKATRALSQATRLMPIPMSGTPLFASPHELAPILEFSGHLSPIFGGLGAFLDRYCKKDKFGNFYARKENLPELRMKLQNYVWVRRRKRDVLPDLPKASLFARYVDVKLTDYHKAYKDVMAVIGLWVDAVVENTGATPDDETIKDWAMSQVGLVSMLRKAAGVAKVPAAVEIIQDHVNDTTEIVAGKKTFTRPLVVWTHHQDVTAAMAAAVPAAVGESGIIAGGTSPAERDRLVSEFQAGNIPVLVCSISAAGVAITLTRSQDSIFVESDWTPAAIRQAIDRQERIGQQNAITATTLLAEGTLDLRIQKVLKEKSAILDVLYGDGNDVSVISADDDVTSASQIVIELVQQVLDTRR